MKTFFATFGTDSPFTGNFIGFLSPDYESAHKAMFQLFDKKWAFLYPGSDLEDQMFRFSIKPLSCLKLHIQLDAAQNGNDEITADIISSQEFYDAVVADNQQDKEAL